MKLIIHIPCYNEERTLPITYADLPKSIPGIDEIEVLVTDDGSSDNTVEVAKEIGVNYIVRNKVNKGLAETFRKGINACLAHGADIIVNTDADNQYKGEDIPKLIKPILENKAEIVVGQRPISEIEHFSLMKKFLQWSGSWFVRMISGTNVADAPSGFRAYTREAAMKMNVVSNYSYTVETIIQAGNNKMGIISVPIGTNSKLRESRLMKSIPAYLKRMIGTIVRMVAFYKSLQFFSSVAAVFGFIGIVLGLRVFINVMVLQIGPFARYLPSTIIAGLCVVISILVFIIGMLADVLNHNRKLSEEILFRVKKLEYDCKRDSSKI